MCNKKERQGFIFTIPLANFDENKGKLSIIRSPFVKVVWGCLNDNGDIIVHVEYDIKNRGEVKELVGRFARKCGIEFSLYPCYSCANVACIFNNTPEEFLPNDEDPKGQVEIWTCENLK